MIYKMTNQIHSSFFPKVKRDFTFLVGQLTDDQKSYVDHLAKKTFESQQPNDPNYRSFTQIKKDFTRGYEAEYELKNQFILLGHDVMDSTEFWCDFKVDIGGVLVPMDCKTRRPNASTYSQTTKEVNYLRQHPNLEVIYVCGEYGDNFREFKLEGFISSKSHKWVNSTKNNGSRFVYISDLEM